MLGGRAASFAEALSQCGSLDSVFQFAFPRLRRVASLLLERERPGHTLQPTALVAEVFLKIHRMQGKFLGEEHFFRIASRAMKQVLIDHARARKQGRRIALDAIPELIADRDGAGDRESLLAVKSIFERLRAADPRAADVVWARCVERRTIDEVSRVQGREIWRVRADYDFGIQWMASRLSGR